jgi:uncharacterized protein
MISRSIQQHIEQRLSPKKAAIILGPRQAGKSTIIKAIIENQSLAVQQYNGDEPQVRAAFQDVGVERLKSLVGNADLLVIDEAQRIENIGLALKIIIDQIGTVKIIASGSSAFELANTINEPLTGRKWEYFLYPLSFGEMVNNTNIITEKSALEKRLLFGSYPEVVTSPGMEQDVLVSLTDSYLYKDILAWEKILKPQKLEQLIKALAFQIGNEVSYSELGQICELDKNTIEKYIGFLEKAFIVFRLSSFSRNLRNELKRSRKIYFYDVGIRNAVINQFSPVPLRQDIGQLWENYWIAERRKFMDYSQQKVNTYFWRTHAGQEIDYLEEANGKLTAFECKWNEKAKVKIPGSFMEAYPNTELHKVSRANFEQFLM